MAPPAAPTALHHGTPLLLPRRAIATATARAARAASLAVRAAQPDTTAASASTSAPEPPPPEFKPPPGFKVPEPKRFEVKPGQQNSVLGASLAIPLRLGTGVFVLGYAPYRAFSRHPRVYLAYGLQPAYTCLPARVTSICRYSPSLVSPSEIPSDQYALEFGGESIHISFILTIIPYHGNHTESYNTMQFVKIRVLLIK